MTVFHCSLYCSFQGIWPREVPVTERTLKDHSRLSAMRSAVTMFIRCTDSEILPHIFGKLQIFHIPPVFHACIKNTALEFCDNT